MKGRNIKIIIFLMTLSVLGLIGVQLYWMANAFKVEEQKFKGAVNNTLTTTVKRLEKRETASVVINKFFTVKDDSDTLITEKDSTSLPTIYHISGSQRKGGQLKYLYKYDAERKDKNDSDITRINYLDWNGKDTSGERAEIVSLRHRIDSVIVRKKNNVNQIFYQLMTVEPAKPILQRINTNSLGKILAEELSNNGITAKYNWGIKANDSDTLLFTNAANKSALSNSEFKAMLFPDDLFGTSYYILVQFPFQKSYVLRNLYLMLSISAALIILIIFLFYRTVSLLISQKKISEIKNDLIDNITHEFKTPISTISLANESIVEPEIITNPEYIRKYSGIITEENNRLRKMVESLLNTAVIEKGNFQLMKEELNVHEVIEELVTKFSKIVEKKWGEIKLKLNAEIPIISGEKIHITGIFTNLLDNAIKFCYEKPEILISTKNEDGTLKITITDNGIGIEKHNIDKIFEIFYRVPTGNVHDTNGYGIGLNYVKKMVEAHNGKISVVSKPSHGTTFEIIFPTNR
jgi:two-component system, OmpR family, phosphate regulon sensor histidine kinase PhoR